VYTFPPQMTILSAGGTGIAARAAPVSVVKTALPYTDRPGEEPEAQWTVTPPIIPYRGKPLPRVGDYARDVRDEGAFRDSRPFIPGTPYVMPILRKYNLGRERPTRRRNTDARSLGLLPCSRRRLGPHRRSRCRPRGHHWPRRRRRRQVRRQRERHYL
jgi:hypothetical protein